MVTGIIQEGGGVKYFNSFMGCLKSFEYFYNSAIIS
jgi:hypothetical protein